MNTRRVVDIIADWCELGSPTLMGQLTATPSRGNEIFSFEYDDEWLKLGSPQQLDPNLSMYSGPQYPSNHRTNFGVFLDSSPDRWGRVLMRRREAQLARSEGRKERRLRESDYLLGVHDEHRMGAIRFRVGERFLDDNDELASPPWTSLRELEHASFQLEADGAEEDPDYAKWLRMLIAPGGSLGGARPKASVRGKGGELWIAKFPSRADDEDVGAWEQVVHQLARMSGVDVPESQLRQFGSSRRSTSAAHRTYLSKRFDRTTDLRRLHFSSAMTLLNRVDGADADDGVSYLDLAEVLIRFGSRAGADLEQLWRRVVFSICVSNTDDHLRNHGFLLQSDGWALAPAYDMNPDPFSGGLKLNISYTDNAQDLELARSVANTFRISAARANEIIDEVVAAVRQWRAIATDCGLPNAAIERMRRAFRVADDT